MSVFFNGQLLVTPQTASAVNDDAMLNQNLSVGNSAAFIGECSRGEPLTVLAFGTPNAAREALGTGDLADAVVNAFSPSTETGAPGTVYAVRVNRSVQASLKLAVNPGANAAYSGDFATLLGNGWSADDLTIRCKIEASPNDAALYNVTVEGTSNGLTWTRTGNEINATRIKLTVKADNSSVAFTQTAKELLHVKIDTGTKDAPDADEQDLAIAPDAYSTIGEVAEFLLSLKNKTGDQVFDIAFDDANDKTLPISVLDIQTVSTKDVATPLTWNQHAFQTWFEQNVPEVTYIAGTDAKATGGFTLGPVAQDFKYLIGTIGQSATPVEWQQAFDLLQSIDVQWVTPVTSEPEYIVMAKDHVTVCSNVLKHERRAITGMGNGVAIADAIQLAADLNSDRVSLVHLGHYRYDDNGKLQLKPAYMTAALISAAFAGVNPGTPMTNKSLNVQGLEKNLLNPTETDQLLLGGVIPVENTDTGYKVTQSISTWRVDTKYNKREQSCGVAIDYTVRNVRQAVDPLRGQKQSPILLSRAESLTKGALTELARPEPQGPAVLVGDENSPAWRNVTATIEGDVLRIQFEASPAIPNNYILVTMYAVPYSGSATA